MFASAGHMTNQTTEIIKIHQSFHFKLHPDFRIIGSLAKETGWQWSKKWYLHPYSQILPSHRRFPSNMLCVNLLLFDLQFSLHSLYK